MSPHPLQSDSNGRNGILPSSANSMLVKCNNFKGCFFTDKQCWTNKSFSWHWCFNFYTASDRPTASLAAHGWKCQHINKIDANLPSISCLPFSSQTIVETLTILQRYSSGENGAKQLEKELRSPQKWLLQVKYRLEARNAKNVFIIRTTN